MQHRQCTAGTNRPRSLFPAAAAATAETFLVPSVDLTKASCKRGFKELPSSADWSGGICITASTQVCLRGSGPELIHIVAEFSGTSTLSSTLHIDDEPVAWFDETDGHEKGPPFLQHTVDTIVLLAGGCHKVTVVHDDGGAVKSIDDDESAHYHRKARSILMLSMSREHSREHCICDISRPEVKFQVMQPT
jgi:hypothetical protein